MRLRHLFFVGLVLLSAPAQAHFNLQQPVDWLATSSTGDPQKTKPCGDTGPRSFKGTRVRAGSTLHIKLTETIEHGGHYRVALSPNRSAFVDPVPVVQNNDCKSAPIQSPPVAPVLADGLFQHTQGQFGSDKVWETDITLPSTPCPSCTLQVLEFMTPHAPSCFYYHCADLEIVDADASVPDGGVVITFDGGTPQPGVDSGGGNPGSDSGGGSGDGGIVFRDAGSGGKAAPPADDGCSVVSVGDSAAGAGGALGVLFALAAIVFRRRR